MRGRRVRWSAACLFAGDRVCLATPAGDPAAYLTPAAARRLARLLARAADEAEANVRVAPAGWRPRLAEGT